MYAHKIAEAKHYMQQKIVPELKIVIYHPAATAGGVISILCTEGGGWEA